MHLMSLGLSNQGIAAQLALSPKTIEAASRGAFLKLGLVEERAHENRRVLAIRRYQEMVTTGEQEPLYLDEAGLFAASLLDRIPHDYDELVAMLEATADTSEHPWATWALAAWSAVIADDLHTAAKCARHAGQRAALHGPFPSTIVAALEHIIAVAAANAAIDHELLDRLAAMIDPAAPAVAGAMVDTMDSILEFAHWMVFCDRAADAHRFIARARRPVGDGLDPTRIHTAAGAEAELGLRTGDWRKVYELVQPVIDSSQYGAAYYRSLAARAALLAGDHQRAAEEIRIGSAAATVRNDRTSLRRLQAAEGTLCIRQGRPADAAAILRRLRSSLAPAAARLPSFNPWQADLVEALVATGAHDEARALTAELGAITDTTGSAWTAALHQRCRGLTATDGTERRAALGDSADRFGQLRGVYDQAYSLRLLATEFAAAGMADSADRVHADAMELFRRGGCAAP